MTEKEPAGHVAVVYFHGMGSQRRFEETSRLVDRFDTYVDLSYRQGSPIGKLRNINARAEQSLNPDKPDVTYISCLHLRDPDNSDGKTTNVHFYEAYWADEMAESRSTWGVVKWLLRQIWRPVSMLWTPWRERQRVRRAALIELLEHSDSWPKGTREKDFNLLLELYQSFDHPNWLRKAKPDQKGDFASFLAMIATRNERRPERTRRLTELARAWRRRYLRSEIIGFVVLVSLLLTIALMVGALAVAVLFALTQVPALLDWLGLGQQVPIPDRFVPTLPNALGLALALLLALGVRQFLVSRLADVQAWSSYAETSENFRKREAVLTKSVDLLSHVVSQPACQRVVVIGHSLGTSVAYDTLLAAVHANRAINPQEPMTGRVDFNKISHFVTLASPIDKISYFFESFRSPVRRYRQIYDALRGDIGTAPFCKSGAQPHIHWLNIWDRADIISGPIHSPAAATGTTARVDNLHVDTLTYFNPGAAHGAYFDHRGVIRRIFEIVFDNRGAYGSKTLAFLVDEAGRKSGLDYRGADFGPGEGNSRWRGVLFAGLLTPWLWLLWVMTWLADAGRVQSYLLIAALLITALPVVALLSRFARKTGSSEPLD